MDEADYDEAPSTGYLTIIPRGEIFCADDRRVNGVVKGRVARREASILLVRTLTSRRGHYFFLISPSNCRHFVAKGKRAGKKNGPIERTTVKNDFGSHAIFNARSLFRHETILTYVK